VKVGFITHLSGKVSLNTSAPTAELPAKTDCRVGSLHYAQNPTGSNSMFPLCSKDVKNK